MKEVTLKKLGFIEAYEFLFDTDEFAVKCRITEESEEFGEWQEFKEENETKIAQYKKKFKEMLYNVDKSM